MSAFLGGGALRRVEVVEVDDTGPIQQITVKGLADEEFELPLRGQPHGLTGNPRVGAVGYVFMSDGNPDTAFLLNLEHPDDRPSDLKSGEAKAYGAAGQTIHMNENGDIIAKTPGIWHVNPPE